MLAKNSLSTIPEDFLFRQFVVGIFFCILYVVISIKKNLLGLLTLETTSSLSFFLVRRAKRPRQANDHSRD